MAEIEDRALKWLRTNSSHPDEPVEVVTVRAYGTDWAGDTDAGFHSEAKVVVVWKSPDGHTHHYDVGGSEFESFWEWMVCRA